MKTHLTSKPKPILKNQRILSTSLQKKGNKKVTTKLAQPKKINLAPKQKKTIQRQKSKMITIVQQKTQNINSRKKKTVRQEPQFLKEFQQITQIYKNSQDIQNEQEISLFCLDQNLDDYQPTKKMQPFNSVFNRYSEKSISQLPSIAEKDIQQEKQDQMLTFRHQKRHQSNLSTASNYPKKVRNIKGNFINEFDLGLRCGSHQKKLTIDVQNLIKSRSKAKSSMSNQSSKAKDIN